MKNVYISEFDSEKKLRSEDAYSLPELNIFASRNNLLTRGMDALTLTMLDEGDIIITADELPQVYMDYWSKNICSVTNHTPNSTKDNPGDDTIYDSLIADTGLHNLLTAESTKIVNYALIPEYYQMCDKLGIENREPPLNLIKELNSKMYSNDLKYSLDLPAKGIALHSVEEYENEIQLLLPKYGNLMIKDAMGVSGKGMMLIDSERTAKRLSEHFRKQSEKGKTDFSFILEPELKRLMDFSSLIYIDEAGNIKIQGYQKNVSKGYSYLGTEPLARDEYDMIMASGYSDVVMRIADDIQKRGYNGFICVDSMITEDSQVIPLLEINPRMSISRFNLMISEKTGKKCMLSYYEGKKSDDISVERFLSDLDNLGILYTKEKGAGIIPLAPGIWNAEEVKGQRVRIYYIIIYEKQDEYEKIFNSWITYCVGSVCASGNAKKST